MHDCYLHVFFPPFYSKMSLDGVKRSYWDFIEFFSGQYGNNAINQFYFRKFVTYIVIIIHFHKHVSSLQYCEDLSIG